MKHIGESLKILPNLKYLDMLLYDNCLGDHV